MKYSQQFKDKKELVQSKFVSAGFDGFIDYVVKPVKTRADESNCTYFPTIDKFGEKITSLAGISGNVELVFEKQISADADRTTLTVLQIWA